LGTSGGAPPFRTPGPVDRQQLPAEQIKLPAQQHELQEYRPEGRPGVVPEVGDVLKSGFRCRSSQMTSMLRWVSTFPPPARAHPVQLARVHQLNSIFAIFRVSDHDKALVLKSRCL
jgi:hypothetical protein